MNRHSLICRLGLGDTVKVPTSPGNIVTEINFIASKKRLDFGLGTAVELVTSRGLKPTELSIDLLILAGVLTAADTRIGRAADSEDSWTREIELVIPVSDPARWEAVGPSLTQAIAFLTGDYWTLKFRPRPQAMKTLVPPSKVLPLDPPTSVCLLSGGLDSFIGALDLLAAGERPLFVSHYWDGTTSIHQTYCFERLEAKYNDRHLFNLRARIGFPTNVVNSGTVENTLRGRSFLFFALAALTSSALGSGAIIYVPENGFISLNVPLDQLRLGSLSTRTTHPFYMARWNQFLSELGIHGSLENPYRFQTKGQMARNCKDQDLLKRCAKSTMSCSHPVGGRFQGESPGHCGRCVPCLIRRAALVAGLGADDTDYKIKDLKAKVLNAEKAEGEHIRSFQVALSNLASRPKFAKGQIHQSGPLSDYDENEILQYEKVYRDGLAEVGAILSGVKCRPL